MGGLRRHVVILWCALAVSVACDGEPPSRDRGTETGNGATRPDVPAPTKPSERQGEGGATVSEREGAGGTTATEHEEPGGTTATEREGTGAIFQAPPAKVQAPDAIAPARRKTFEQKLEEARKRLGEGEVAFPARATMRQGEEYELTVRVSATGEVSKEGIFGDDIAVEDIQISPLMVACLQADEGEFLIRSLGSGDLPESKPADTSWRACRLKTVTGSRTDWEWSVKPLVSGERQLLLTIEARLIVDGDHFTGPGFPALRRTIHVEPDPLYALGVFWKNNWRWILGVLFGSGLLAPFVKRGVRKLLNRKHQHREAHQPH